MAGAIAGIAVVSGLAMANPEPASAASISHRLPKLHKGDHNSLVVRLQRELSAHGKNVAATGHFGKATKKRVKKIQRQHGWRATGVVGSGVWHVLLSDGRRVSSPSIKPYLRSSGRKAQSAPANSVWDKLARCESGGRWHINTGNGFYGGLQFTLSTWHAYGGSGMPNKHSRSEQIAVAQRVQRSQGWGAWPACSSRIGLR
ncbi:transglycosylase family protein [Microlunatus sp. Gsoil 973]|uniref:transglycosylase family protein n=1 Tax=Microlunatus sp. Gsoil 973 TaxID=2672569 RepID=UPI0018A806E7|nr:transglycosylase family protein [Microlunatus sp. Gsoil 973]